MSFINLKDIEPKEIVAGFNGRFIHSDNITVAHWEIKAGSEIPVHHHVHEMIVNVIKGKLELTIGSETRVLEEGMCAVIASHVPHKAKAVTDCYVIDVFYPLRSDYR